MTHLSPAGRRSRNGVTGLLIAGAICAGVAAPPASAASEQDARAAASRGAQWLVGNLLQSDGSGLGGFGLTGLAAGGIHPADAVASGGSASAADNTLAAWRANGPGTRANDVARSLLSAHAAGIDRRGSARPRTSSRPRRRSGMGRGCSIPSRLKRR